MKPECAQAIAKALGREMTEKELAAVESGISKSIRQLGAQDPQAEGEAGGAVHKSSGQNPALCSNKTGFIHSD